MTIIDILANTLSNAVQSSSAPVLTFSIIFTVLFIAPVVLFVKAVIE